MFNLNFEDKLLINCYPYNLVLKGLGARSCTSDLEKNSKILWNLASLFKNLSMTRDCKPI